MFNIYQDFLVMCRNDGQAIWSGPFVVVLITAWAIQFLRKRGHFSTNSALCFPFQSFVQRMGPAGLQALQVCIERSPVHLQGYNPCLWIGVGGHSGSPKNTDKVLKWTACSSSCSQSNWIYPAVNVCSLASICNWSMTGCTSVCLH